MNIKNVVAGIVLPLLLASCGGASDTSPTAAPAAAAALTLSFTPTKAFHFTWTDVSDATYYKLKEAKTVDSGYTSINDNITSVGAANSFDHVVPLYDRLNSKYILQSCNSVGCRDSDEVFTSTKVSQMVSSIGYIKASNTDAEDLFSHTIALSGDGNTLAVGAPYEASGIPGLNNIPSDNSGWQTGAVYVFVRSGKTWTQQAFIKASNADNFDRLAFSGLSLSADGNTLAVGADRKDSNSRVIDGNQTDNSSGNSGAVYVFTRIGAEWSQQAYLKSSDSDADDRFGTSLDLSMDGNTLAVGAEGHNGFTGAVYVFSRLNETWSQQSILIASNADPDMFGHSTSLSSDGNTLAIGAWYEESADANQSDNSTPLAGAAYIFERNGSGWSQQAYIKPSTIGGDSFGERVRLSGDSNTLAVSAVKEDSNAVGVNGDESDNSAENAGAVYIFVRSGEIWVQQGYLKASNTDIDDNFGISISFTEDGNTLAIGASHEASPSVGFDGIQQINSAPISGAVYLFNRTGTIWTQKKYLKASNTNLTSQAGFGYTVSVSSDGFVIAVGAPGEESNASGVNGDESNVSKYLAGAVYLY